MGGRRILLVGGGGLLLFVIALLAFGGGARASCVFTSAYNIAPQDYDGDGFNESVAIQQNWPGAGFDYYYIFNISLTDSYGYFDFDFATQRVHVDATYGGSLSEKVTLPSDFAHDTYYIYVTEDNDDGAGPCLTDSYTYDLYPLGNYTPALSSPTPAQSGDQDSTVNYTLEVTGHSNLPDIVHLTASSTSGWSIAFSSDTLPLNDSQSVNVTVSVSIPRNTAPLFMDSTTVFAQSRNFVTVLIELNTTVRAQAFGAGLTCPNATQSAAVLGSANFTVRLTNTGNNHDNFTVAASAPPFGWGIDFEPRTVALDAGAFATVNVSVHMPAALSGTLTWSPMLTALAGDNTTSASIDLHASLLLPDLVVAPGDITLDNSAPKAGDIVVVHVNVRNSGYIASLDVVVRLSDGTKNLTTTVTVGLLGSGLATFNWPAVPGHIDLAATVDSTNSVPESDESNNNASVSVTVNGPPTAAVGNATASGTVGGAVSFSAAASTDADGTVSEYYFDFGDGTNSGWVTTSAVTHAYAAPGNYTALIRVRDNSGLESQNATSRVSVSAAAAAPPAGGGADMLPLLLVVVIAAAAAVGAMVMMRKRKKPGP